MNLKVYKSVNTFYEDLCKMYKPMSHGQFVSTPAPGITVTRRAFFISEQEFESDCQKVYDDDNKSGQFMISDVVFVLKTDGFKGVERLIKSSHRFDYTYNFMLLKKAADVKPEDPTEVQVIEDAYDAAETAMYSFFDWLKNYEEDDNCTNVFGDILDKSWNRSGCVNGKYYGWDITFRFEAKPGNGYGDVDQNQWQQVPAGNPNTVGIPTTESDHIDIILNNVAGKLGIGVSSAVLMDWNDGSPLQLIYSYAEHQYNVPVEKATLYYYQPSMIEISGYGGIKIPRIDLPLPPYLSRLAIQPGLQHLPPIQSSTDKVIFFGNELTIEDQTNLANLLYSFGHQKGILDLRNAMNGNPDPSIFNPLVLELNYNVKLGNS